MPRELPEPPDPDAIDFVTGQAASEHGYLLPPQGVNVYRRTPWKDVYYLVASWEADAVRYLLEQKRLVRGRPVVASLQGDRCRMFEVEV